MVPAREGRQLDDRHIRKHSWSAIFGSVKSIVSENSFDAAARGASGASRTRDKHASISKPVARDVRQATGSDHVHRAVRKHADDLHAALRGGYPGDDPEFDRRQHSQSAQKSISVTPADYLEVNRVQQSQNTQRSNSAARPNTRGKRGSSVPEASLSNSHTRHRAERATTPGGLRVPRRHLQQEQPSLTPPKPPMQPAAPSKISTASMRDATSAQPSRSTGRCDKCDGPHSTDACPHFKKPREKHKDAWANYGNARPRELGASGGNVLMRKGQCVRQPGDGSCLFHSLCFGLNRSGNCGRVSAHELRSQLSGFIAKNPNLDIAGDTLEEWVRWDANSSCSSYARRMSTGGWGGGIEMAACSLLKKVNVHVYERARGGFKRISCFDCPEPPSATIYVLYQGGVHYDALVPD